MERIVFSGIKPSGNLHLGNYIGAMKQWKESEAGAKNIFCIVDLHAITVPQSPTELTKNTYDLVAMLLSVGIDPKESLLFVQSQNPDHSNLGWVLNCFVSMGQLSRMTQYKEKSEGKPSVSVGLFDYPALMAADILLYGATEVPVGEDQKQHVELTRDIAEKFNKLYGETFTIPSPVIKKVGGRVMSLTDPTKKMSKSVANPGGTINLLDSPEEAKRKIMSATTDSENSVKFDGSRPGITNLIEIYSNLSGKEISALESEFEGKGYKEFKGVVAEEVAIFLSELQEKFNNFRNEDNIKNILEDGKSRSYEISHPKLTEVYKKIGFV